MQLYVIDSPAGHLPTHTIAMDKAPSGVMFQTQQPLIMDVDSETRFPDVLATLRKSGIKSSCYLPLTTPLRRLGALTFGSFEKGKFADDIPFLRRVANQVAVAVDNALHFDEAQQYQEELKHERDRLRILLEINNAIASRLELHEFLEAVSSSLRGVLQHELIGIGIHESRMSRLRLHVLNSPGGQGGREGMAVPVEGTFLKAALNTRKPIRLSGFDRKEVPDGILELLGPEGPNSGAVLPLIAGDKVLGAFVVVSKRENAVGEREMDFLTQIAAQVVIGLANALAYKEIDQLRDRLQEEKLYLEDEIRNEYFDEIVGESPSLMEVLDQVRTVAMTDSTVLVLGETGTGKELIARAIHNTSPRRQKTFVKLNCSAIPTGLLESELFGHERGAFTGAIAQKIGRMELADGGTLFLDEIGDIPMELQPKLLRALQEREFERLGSTRTIKADIRLIAATHRDLKVMVAERQFRSDLFYRLNVFPIKLPPLRDRADDIPRLVRHFASKHAHRMNKQIDTIPAETMRALVRWQWPGNIRELENFIERAVILSRGSVLSVPVSELQAPAPLVAAASAAASVSGQTQVRTFEESEREHILKILRATKGILSGPDGAAARLGLKRTTLQGKMKKLGIDRKSY
jgi:formate hydrogenlyase transcriptional activator